MFVCLAAAGPARHGNERIVVERKAKDDSLQFKEVRPDPNGNGTEGQEPLFKTMKGEDMNITMESANITTQGYLSDTVKLQQTYHHYNNTNLFVTFKEKYLKKQKAKDLAVEHVKNVLQEHPGNFTRVRVKKAYQSYVVFELGGLTERRPAAELLSKQDAVLAIEWLQQKRLFGISADIGEMSKFKSKIRKDEEINPKKEEKKDEKTDL